MEMNAVETSDSRARGDASEQLVEDALTTIIRKHEALLASGKTPKDLPALQGFVHAKPNDELDRQKIDFMVRSHNGEEVPLQVKSSARGLRKFMKACRKLGLKIQVIVVSPGEALQTVIPRLIKCLHQGFNTVRRMIQKAVHQERVRKEEKEWHAKRKTWCYRVHTPLVGCH